MGTPNSLATKVGDSNAGGLNGQDFGHRLMAEPAFKLPSDLLHQGNVHLMIQETVHLQYIAGPDDSVFYNSLFKKIHD